MNSFGKLFRVHIFGESHGLCVGICIDGCPPGITLCEKDFENDITRRRSGKKGTTPRVEADIPEIMSGVFNGFTTGAPIVVVFRNTSTHSGDYSQFVAIPRPSHADFVARVKYGNFTDYRGGGHFSGRITAGFVAAGVVAKKILAPATVEARICEIGGCNQWEELIEQCIVEHDSIGGLVECVIDGIPAGVGEPFFDGIESVISQIVFAIPAVKGIEFGAGFAAARMKGSEHNDPITSVGGATSTNNAGGANGGIANGNQIKFRVAIKPAASIAKQQQTMNINTGMMTALEIPGRHDCCIALRTPPIIEAAAAIALADLKMRTV
jgi:chorismate synthase